MALDNRLRVIGGLWRGRKISFPDRIGLRPTADRMRETLFNWLREDIDSSRCLDLFAGSGALGFEAASRGALRVVMVDSDPVAVKSLAQIRQSLGAEQTEIIHADFSVYLQGTKELFDLVFIDPPFNRELIVPACKLLETGWLKPHARIYIETELVTLPQIPENWQVMKYAKAGHSHCFLLERL